MQCNRGDVFFDYRIKCSEAKEVSCMIEISESITIAKQLNETVRGKLIKEVEAAHTPHSFAWYSGDPEFYQENLIGKQIGLSAGIGAMVEIEVGDFLFIIGDGTNVRFFSPEVKLPEKYQTRITFEDDSHLIFTIQMYGAMYLAKKNQFDNPYYIIAKTKPLLHKPDFDFTYFTVLLQESKQNLTLKAFLATEQRIPGLGNGTLQDILFAAKMNPKRKISTLSNDDRTYLFSAIKDTIAEMIDKNGRNTEKDLFGKTGTYRTIMSKLTLSTPCPNCGSNIEKQNYMGGTVYICPQCQPE